LEAFRLDGPALAFVEKEDSMLLDGGPEGDVGLSGSIDTLSGTVDDMMMVMLVDVGVLHIIPNALNDALDDHDR
jgi:hypothetical protein